MLVFVLVLVSVKKRFACAMHLNNIEIAVVVLGVLFVSIIAGVIVYFCCRRRYGGKRYKKIGSKAPNETSLIYNNAPTMYYPPTVSMTNPDAAQQSTMAIGASGVAAPPQSNDAEQQEIMRVKKLMRDQMLTKEEEKLAETVLIAPSKADTNEAQIQKQQDGLTDATLMIEVK